MPITSLHNEDEEEQKVMTDILNHKGKLSGELILPYESKADLQIMPTKNVQRCRAFGRSGFIPFAKHNDDIIMFFVLFRGEDREFIVCELSDFGGRTENQENFVRSACYETLEESLGIFNFLGQECAIRELGMSCFSEDMAVITTAVPVELNIHPVEVCTSYNRLKKMFNDKPKNATDVPKKNFQCRKILEENNKIFDQPLTRLPLTKDRSSFVCGDDKVRHNYFNCNETSHVVYMTLSDVKSLLCKEAVFMPEQLFRLTGGYYTHYPPFYFAIASKLRRLLPFIESYYSHVPCISIT